jgi:hypothetical protein
MLSSWAHHLWPEHLVTDRKAKQLNSVLNRCICLLSQTFILDVGTGPKPILVQQINSYLEMGQPDLTLQEVTKIE